MRRIKRLTTVNGAIAMLLLLTFALFSFERFHAAVVRDTNDDLETCMRTFRELLRQKGESFKIENGKLLAGSYVISGNFEVPDKIQEIFGETATVFMGDIRVSTNVLQKDGRRAVGTRLEGAAYDAVFKQGKPFKGETRILGVPYITSYDPIRDNSGKIIGALYVGMKKSEFLGHYSALKTELALILLGMLSLFATLMILFHKVAKRAEKLKEADLLFLQTLIDTIPNPIFYKDANGKYLGCNRAYESFIGLPRERLVGKSVFDIAPPHLAEIYHRADLELFQKQGVQTYESAVVYADGVPHDVIFFKAAFPAADGSPGGLIGTMLDISDRKRAEMELRESRQHMLDIIEFYPDAIMEIDSGGKVVAWNRAMEELSGVPAEEILGRGDYEYSLPFYGERRPILIDLAMQSEEDTGNKYVRTERRGKTLIGEAYIHNARGEELYFHGTAASICNSSGEIIGAIESVRDITERRKTETIIAEKEQFVSSIFDSIQDGISVLDEEFHIVRANSTLESRFPDKMPIVGRKCYEVFHGRAEACEICPSIRTLKSGDPCSKTYTIKENETEVWLELSTFPLFDAEKSRVTAVIEITRNITEQKNAENREKGRRNALELLAGGAPLTQVLEVIARAFEQERVGSLCSILLLDAQQQRLLLGAAPSLPDFYNNAIHGMEIGPAAGSCGSAAYSGKRVIVEDILTHPFWESFRPLAQEAGLRSCCSEPVFSSAGVVLGTFAVYYREPRAPGPDELKLIIDMATLAGIAIEHARIQDKLFTLSCGIEQSPASIVITNREGCIEYVNPKFTSLTGYTLAEAIGQNPRILKTEKTPAEIHRQLWDTITKGAEWHGEFCNKKKNGELYWESASISPIIDAEGSITRFIAVKEDITDRKKIEEELKFKNSILATQLEVAIDAILIVDESAAIISYNRQFVEMWGIPPELVDAREDAPVLQFVATRPVDQEGFLARVRHLYENRSEKSRDEIALKDGRVFDRYSAPMTGVDGRYYGRVWYFRDITEQKLAEENILKLNEELEIKVKERTRQLFEAQEELVRKEKLSILGQLSGSVGHELRNPLGVMSNAIYFLKMVHADADATTKEYLDIIKQEIDNSQRIITDLLDFARTRTPQTKTVTVHHLLDESLAKCAIPGNVSIQADIAEKLPLLRIDPLQMGQVFQNLITNAVQAMPDGGALRIAARPDADFIEISIEDTGQGISPENMNKLFQPLFTTKAKGIGLGLVVCRNLIEANGGRIEVGSELGVGTTFRVILPLETEPGMETGSTAKTQFGAAY
jgi:nitrogen fixation negative regulator NifL